MTMRNDQIMDGQFTPLEDLDPVSEVETAVVHLLNVAVVMKHGDPEPHFECKLCGQLDDVHLQNCPVPLLEEWINPSTLN